MRNTSVRVLVGAGAFSLSLAALTAGYAAPALLKAPVVNSTSTQASGSATRLDSATGKQVSGEFRQFRAVGTHTTTKGGKPVAVGGGDVAVYDSYSETSFVPQGSTTVQPLTKSVYTQAFDRSTGAGVPSDPADTLGTTAQLFKFPFGVEKRTYQLWDSQAEKAFPARFVKETTVDGLAVYEFTQDVTATDLGELPVLKAVPGALVGEPQTPSIPADQWVENLGKKIYVEPVTGSLVGGSSNPHVWAQTADGRKVDLLKVTDAHLTPASLSTQVEEASSSASKARLLQRAPWLLGALGVLLLGLAVRGRRRGTAAPAVVDLTDDGLQARRADVTGVLPVPRDEARPEARQQY